jgi:diguanylate cyclase (GGDEF)-like protein
LTPLRVIEALRPAWPAATILLAAVLAAWVGPPLPSTLSGLRTAAPYAALVTAAAVSAWFNRGRALVVAASLFAAFAVMNELPGRGVYTAAAILVPLNVLFAVAFAERGAPLAQSLRWLALLALEMVFAFLSMKFHFLDSAMNSALLRSPPTPLLARLVFAGAIAVALGRGWPAFTPIEVGIPASLAAFFIASEWSHAPGTFALFMTAAAVVLLVAVLHESHRMAFRDGLTGLPNRRALEEQLRALSGEYTIAMVDVDHFKSFNDTHGHDTGDQVLRLVAARLDEVEGGGRVFRYGGEEFTVLFPGHLPFDVMPHLEKVRATIEKYRIALRADDRPEDTKEGLKRRADEEGARPRAKGSNADNSVSVTVSMGAASPGKKLKTAAEVIKAADEALYRAKQGGRNRISR